MAKLIYKRIWRPPSPTLSNDDLKKLLEKRKLAVIRAAVENGDWQQLHDEPSDIGEASHSGTSCTGSPASGRATEQAQHLKSSREDAEQQRMLVDDNLAETEDSLLQQEQLLQNIYNELLHEQAAAEQEKLAHKHQLEEQHAEISNKVAEVQHRLQVLQQNKHDLVQQLKLAMQAEAAAKQQTAQQSVLQQQQQQHSQYLEQQQPLQQVGLSGLHLLGIPPGPTQPPIVSSIAAVQQPGRFAGNPTGGPLSPSFTSPTAANTAAKPSWLFSPHSQPPPPPPRHQLQQQQLEQTASGQLGGRPAGPHAGPPFGSQQQHQLYSPQQQPCMQRQASWAGPSRAGSHAAAAGLEPTRSMDFGMPERYGSGGRSGGLGYKHDRDRPESWDSLGLASGSSNGGGAWQQQQQQQQGVGPLGARSGGPSPRQSYSGGMLVGRRASSSSGKAHTIDPDQQLLASLAAADSPEEGEALPSPPKAALLRQHQHTVAFGCNAAAAVPVESGNGRLSSPDAGHSSGGGLTHAGSSGGWGDRGAAAAPDRRMPFGRSAGSFGDRPANPLPRTSSGGSGSGTFSGHPPPPPPNGAVGSPTGGSKPLVRSASGLHDSRAGYGDIHHNKGYDGGQWQGQQRHSSSTIDRLDSEGVGVGGRSWMRQQQSSRGGVVPQGQHGA